MRSPNRIILALFACTLAAGAWASPQPAPETTAPQQPPRLAHPNFSTLQTGTVTRVLDENTVLIDIDGSTARYHLLGVAALPSRDKAHAALALDALSRMALGETVAIQHDPLGERNAANRLAAYIYRAPDHLPINLELVRQGYTRHSSAWMSIHNQPFLHHQSRAQELQRGIWNPDEPILNLANQNHEPQTNPSPETSPADPTDPEPATHHTHNPGTTFYITEHGTRYHLENCPHLTDSTRPTTYNQIKDSHQPCKTCRPAPNP